jgi:hypothetical protein
MLIKINPKNENRLIINVDPLPGQHMTLDDHNKIFDIVRAMGFQVNINFTTVGNFGKAFKWCWGHAEADWVLNLEDDWELVTPVDIMDMIFIMNDHPELASLRLPQFDASDDGMKNWNLWFPWNGNYFECPEELTVSQGFCGHPSLIRGEFVRACAPLINPTKNPEKQFHGGNDPLTEEVAKWRFGVYGRPNQPHMINDLGRQWMVENGFRKEDPKAYFMNWKKHTEEVS